MKRQSVTIHPDSGRLTVDFTTGDGTKTCLIEFGNSFTLRLDEGDIDKLRHALYDASNEVARERIDELPPITKSVIEPELWARLQK